MAWNSVSYVSICAESNSLARRTMEDAHLTMEGLAGVEGQCLFAVFDGHGGTGIVKYIERTFVKCLEGYLKGEETFDQTDSKDLSPMDAMISTFTEIDHRSAADGVKSSGSTAVSCILRKEGNDRKLYVANVGDTRAVLCRQGGEALRLTYDHTATDPAEVKRIEAAGGFVLRNRVLGILSVARAIGDHSMKKYIISRPHTKELTLTPTDRFLIIACDGVWDVFSDQEAVDLVITMIDKENVNPNETATRLVKSAVDKGSQDNVTALIIFF